MVLIAAVAALAGCAGSGDRLSRADYQTRIREISLGDEAQQAVRLYGDLVLPGLSQRECARRAGRFHETLEETVADVDALRPPADVEHLHDAFVDAARESVARVGELAEDVRDGRLACGDDYNRLAYGMASTRRAERVIEQLEAMGYSVRGD